MQICESKTLEIWTETKKNKSTQLNSTEQIADLHKLLKLYQQAAHNSTSFKNGTNQHRHGGMFWDLSTA